MTKSRVAKSYHRIDDSYTILNYLTHLTEVAVSNFGKLGVVFFRSSAIVQDDRLRTSLPPPPRPGGRRLWVFCLAVVNWAKPSTSNSPAV